MVFLGKMKAKTTLDLENIGLSKIAVKLWDIKCIPNSFNDMEWFDSEQIIMKTAEQFKLPKILIEKIKIFIRIVGLEIYRFLQNLNIMGFNIEFSKSIASYICWTELSTVNLQETIYCASKDNQISIFDRYRLCCCFCFENGIHELWSQLSESEKYFFLHPKETEFTSANYWSIEITGTDYDFQKIIGVRGMFSKIEWAIENSVKNASKYATQYYLNKLSFFEKNDNILQSLFFIEKKYFVSVDSPYRGLYSNTHWDFHDMILFLFSQINEEFLTTEIMQLCEIKIHRILQSHLDWPHQEEFLTVMDDLQNYIKHEDYLVIIQVILYKMKCNCKDYDYKILLQSAMERFAKFSNKPLSLLIAENFLSFLPSFENESVLLMLSCIMPNVKEEIIFHSSGQRLLRYLANKDQDLLQLVIISCVPEKIVDKLKPLFFCDENVAHSQINLTIIKILNDIFSKKLLQSDK